MKGHRVAVVSFPLLFAALTGRSGHGLARMRRIRPRPLGLFDLVVSLRL